eukprot:TRINITY_DN5490_c0_g1_i1.p1 TRINITY_DN5490_c0_g1~~TRINITY_DN5490_c0_g1_i1.p1  ORF type:complete len:624 (-),score=122.67 TRINITY_DN5490_c0_g1_i1:767-2611(-)
MEACEEARYRFPSTPLQWCAVTALPEVSTVVVSVDVAGLVDDLAAIEALGISTEHSVRIRLQFSETDFERGSQTLEPVHVAVDKMDKVDPLAVKYGLDVLFPDLVRAYFEAHAKRSKGGSESQLNGQKDGPNEQKVGPMRHLGQALMGSLGMAPASSACGMGGSHLATPQESGNVFVGLLNHLCERWASLSTWCPVCRDTLPINSARLRPCNKQLCLYKFEELGLGAAVLPEVKNNPELLQLEIVMAAAAASSNRDVFEPFPSFLINKEDRRRGRAGYFSSADSKRQHLTTGSGGSTKKPVATEEYSGGLENKNLELVLDLLDNIPEVNKLKEHMTETSLVKGIVKAWEAREERQGGLQRVHATEANGAKGNRESGANAAAAASEVDRLLPYKLMRFVVSTNRLTIRRLSEDQQLPLTGTSEQYVVVSDSPEREAIFNRRRAESGSFCAFHGSTLANWYSILRNGLRSMSNTKYMSTGATYGAGIYLSSSLTLSAGYSSQGASGFFSRRLLRPIILAIVEAVQGTTTSNQNSIMVADGNKEQEVCIRYLLVYTNSARWTDAIITGNVLTEVGGASLNLTDNFAKLRMGWEREMEEEKAKRREARKCAMMDIGGD